MMRARVATLLGGTALILFVTATHARQRRVRSVSASHSSKRSSGKDPRRPRSIRS